MAVGLVVVALAVEREARAVGVLVEIGEEIWAGRAQERPEGGWRGEATLVMAVAATVGVALGTVVEAWVVEEMGTVAAMIETGEQQAAHSGEVMVASLVEEMVTARVVVPEAAPKVLVGAGAMVAAAMVAAKMVGAVMAMAKPVGAMKVVAKVVGTMTAGMAGTSVEVCSEVVERLATVGTSRARRIPSSQRNWSTHTSPPMASLGGDCRTPDTATIGGVGRLPVGILDMPHWYAPAAPRHEQ